ncbi:MAG: prolipoprotein diacylglyceryl transferase [Fimbriimonadaceae bacterium]|nr:prolipoprotein diacylglyceryl transferase [Fimbriimonadaceae bacterium]
MQPFVNKFNPFMLGPFHVGGLGEVGIRWYGMAYVLGFVFAYLGLKKAMDAGKVRGLDAKGLENLTFGIILGVLVGGRMGFVVQNMDRWREDPLFPLRLQEGGMAFFGGLVGVIVAIALFGRKNKTDFYALGDVLAPLTALALGIGRIANFINGELWGKPTGGDWGVIYPRKDMVPRHPSELYECATHLLLALVLWRMSKTTWGSRRGFVSATFVIGYGLFRIVTEVYRDQPYYVGPFSAGQIASALTALVGVGMLVFNMKRAQSSQRSDDCEPATVERSETIHLQ